MIARACGLPAASGLPGSSAARQIALLRPNSKCSHDQWYIILRMSTVSPRTLRRRWFLPRLGCRRLVVVAFFTGASVVPAVAEKATFIEKPRVSGSKPARWFPYESGGPTCTTSAARESSPYNAADHRVVDRSVIFLSRVERLPDFDPRLGALPVREEGPMIRTNRGQDRRP